MNWVVITIVFRVVLLIIGKKSLRLGRIDLYLVCARILLSLCLSNIEGWRFGDSNRFFGLWSFTPYQYLLRFPCVCPLVLVALCHVLGLDEMTVLRVFIVETLHLRWLTFDDKHRSFVSLLSTHLLLQVIPLAQPMGKFPLKNHPDH